MTETLLSLALIGLTILIICNLLSTYISYHLIKWDIEEIDDNIDLKIDLLQSLKTCNQVFRKGLIYHKDKWFFSTNEDYIRYRIYHGTHPHTFIQHKNNYKEINI